MKRPAIFAAILLVPALSTSCTPQQLATATKYQQDIAQVCQIAMTLAPAAGPVAPWIIGGCSTEDAIARLALDPNSLVWVNSLIVKAKGIF